jgi:hypothetical protein
MSLAPVAEQFRDQYGVVSRRQALTAGLTDGKIQSRLRSGEWSAIHPGVYALAGVRPTWRSSVVAACLATGGVASHRAAARLHGLTSSSVPVEITVTQGRYRYLESVVVHQTTQPDLLDATTVKGVPVTGVCRCLVDVGTLISHRYLQELVDRAILLQEVKWPDLYETLANHSARGRNGCGPLRRLLDDADATERVPRSQWSRMVGSLLRLGGLATPVFEYEVRDDDGTFVAQIDLAYPEHRVAIELDSIAWHLNRASFQRDRDRVNRLSVRGWTVLSFTWEDYVRRPRNLVSIVRRALDLAPQPDLNADRGDIDEYPHSDREGAA